MRKTKKIFYMIAAALLTLSFNACGRRGDVAVPEFGDEEMLIGVWNGPISATYNEQGLDDLKDAGVNLLNFYFPFDTDMLDLADAKGMKVLPSISHDSARTMTQSFDRFFGGDDYSWTTHPALLGVVVMDEPKYSEFEELAGLKPQFYKIMPADKLFHVNLYPSYVIGGGGADMTVLGGTYEDYIEHFANIIKPEALSFDHYALEKDPENGRTVIRSSFFTDLETVAHAAKRHGIPMQFTMQTSGHFNYVSPTVEELRWQMAVSMAFGARSITHYSYMQENSTYQSMVTFTGARTPVFDRVKTVNLEIRKWDNVYMGFRWENTAAIGGRNRIPDFLLRNMKHSPEIKDIDGVQSVTSSEDLLMGCFTDAKGNKGFMLTNATNPWYERLASVTVAFGEEYKAVQIYEKGVPRIIKLDKNNSVKIRVDAGEGKFVIPLKGK